MMDDELEDWPTPAVVIVTLGLVAEAIGTYVLLLGIGYVMWRLAKWFRDAEHVAE